MKRILIDTSPVNSFSKENLNLGYEIVAGKMLSEGSLLRCHYLDRLSKRELSVDEICFSVPYVLHGLNIVPFLGRNGIASLRKGRPRIVVGGSAIFPLLSLSEIADEQFLGEYEGEMIDRSGFHRLSEVDSEVYLLTEKYRGVFAPLNKGLDIKEAVVELARGCPNLCLFCEYRWLVGGRYREKPFDLLAKQLVSIHPESFSKGRQKLVKRLTVRTSNLSACTYLQELSTLCCRLNRKLLWAEVSSIDAEKIIDYFEPLGITRINFGVESFTETVRKRTCKQISDDELAILMKVLMERLNFIKINLIYGLPSENNYDSWFDWLERIAEIRKRIKHKIRLDFAISNLEMGGFSDAYLQKAFADFGSVSYKTESAEEKPVHFAPIATVASPIDFRFKETVFLPRWVETLRKLNLLYRDANQFPSDIDEHGNCRIHGRDYGRCGRTELNHLVIIALRNFPPSVINYALMSSFPTGAHRYFSRHQANSFLNKLKFK